MAKLFRSRTTALLVLTTTLLIVPPNEARAAGTSLPAAVEDVASRSDLIVLGRIVETAPEGIALGSSWQMVYTRHVLEVEAYYKGSGPKEIPLFTPGGFQTRIVNGESKRVWSQVPGAEGAKVDDEFLAFLKAAHGGYVFIEWDGAKYPTQRDRETDERVIDLRLRKKRNMQGSALESFQRVLGGQEGADAEAALEKRLIAKGGLRERVLVEDLQGRIATILQNEQPPNDSGQEVSAGDDP